MGCDEIKQIIPAYVNHTATENQISTVEEHLCVCNDCREYLTKYMDKPNIPIPQKKTAPTPSSKTMGLFDYLVIGIGIVILFVFIYLLMKG